MLRILFIVALVTFATAFVFTPSKVSSKVPLYSAKPEKGINYYYII